MLLKPIESKINWRLMPIKVHYFFWQAGLSPVFPYISSYSRGLGFSSVVVGILYTVMPIIGTLIRPLLGMIADKYQCQKRLFFVCQLLVLTATVGMLYIPKMEHQQYPVKLLFPITDDPVIQISTGNHINNCSLENHENFDNNTIVCDDEFSQFQLTVSISSHGSILENGTLTLPITTFWRGLYKNKSFSCYLQEGSKLYDSFSRPRIENSEIIKKYWCWLYFMAVTIYWICQGTVNSIGDTICFNLLGDEPNKYGEQRLYGALGWGIMSAISGYITDILSDGSATKNEHFSFYLSIVLIIIDIGFCMQLEYKQTDSSNNFLKDVAEFFLNIKYNVFFIWCACVGVCSALIWQFLYWLIEDLLTNTNCMLQFYTKSLEGLIQTIETVFGEVPFFFISGWVFTKIGHIHTMSLIIFGLGIRLILYTMISNPWWFLPIELLNGIDVGLNFACMASYASTIAPKGTEATVQSLVGAIYEGIGVSFGSFIGGMCYEKYGGVNTFSYFACFALFVAMLHVVIQYIIKCNFKNDNIKS